MNSSPLRYAGLALLAVLTAAMVAALCWAVLSLPDEAIGLADEVDWQLDLAGAKNPVTAVLLNFRSYDTLLEIAVLLLAGLGARTLAGRADVVKPRKGEAPSPVLSGLVRLVAPMMVVVAGYLLWLGGYEPGGAFQSGAVLASFGVLLVLGGIAWQRWFTEVAERWILAAGLGVFVAVGVGVMSAERNLLEYPLGAAYWLIVLIEAVSAVSIAVVLVELFVGGKLAESDRSAGERKGPAK